MKNETKNDVMENLIALAKRRGFIFQGSEIYGGLAGTFDYGPYGVALRSNIRNIWWKRFVTNRDDVYGVDAAILMNQKVWKASGHVAGFADPLVEDKKTKKRFRADHLLEDAGVDPKGMTIEAMTTAIRENKLKSPEGNELSDVKQFNMMFKTNIGAMEDESSVSYLRPETAQGMFVNFKNIVDTMHPKLPFGMAQIGKAFRNEISPRDFIFRLRELEQMEIEYFVDPRDVKKVNETIEALYDEQVEFLLQLGLEKSRIHKVEIPEADRAHYSKRSIDTEFDFPFGQKELLGLAYRTDYDLKAHAEASGTDLSYFDEETKTRLVPHCIEPTFGLDRLTLAVLSQAYSEDELAGEKRVFLKLAPSVAPVKIAVFPLLKNKELITVKAQEIYKVLKKEFGAVEYDASGSIGKRYRRQDEIGTPFCVTIDFNTIEKNGSPVTVRDRDTGKQQPVELEELTSYLAQKLGR
jgi:glycyl-tRNA synthetase